MDTDHLSIGPGKGDLSRIVSYQADHREGEGEGEPIETRREYLSFWRPFHWRVNRGTVKTSKMGTKRKANEMEEEEDVKDKDKEKAKLEKMKLKGDILLKMDRFMGNNKKKVPLYLSKQLKTMRTKFGGHPLNEDFLHFLSKAATKNYRHRLLFVEYLLEEYIVPSTDPTSYWQMVLQVILNVIIINPYESRFDDIIKRLTTKSDTEMKAILLDIICDLIQSPSCFVPAIFNLLHAFVGHYQGHGLEGPIGRRVIEEITFCMRRYPTVMIKHEGVILDSLAVAINGLDLVQWEEGWKNDFFGKVFSGLSTKTMDIEPHFMNLTMRRRSLVKSSAASERQELSSFYEKVIGLFMAKPLGDVDLKKPLEMMMSRGWNALAIELIRKHAVPVDDIPYYWALFDRNNNSPQLFQYLFFAGHRFESLDGVRTHMNVEPGSRPEFEMFCRWLEAEKRKVWPLAWLSWTVLRKSLGSRAVALGAQLEESYHIDPQLVMFIKMSDELINGINQ